MARVRNLRRIDLYCPEYMTNATILIDQNHHSGQPHLVAHYEMGGLKGQMQFAAAIPAHWGDDDLIELIFGRKLGDSLCSVHGRTFRLALRRGRLAGFAGALSGPLNSTG